MEEAPDEDDLGIKEDDESSVDSLMAESPGKYGRRGEVNISAQIDEEEMIKKVTKKKIPKKKPPKVAPAPPEPEKKFEGKSRPPRFTQGMPVVKKKLSPKA